MTTYNDRERETRLSDDGERIIIVDRWLDRQVDPPRWRSKNFRGRGWVLAEILEVGRAQLPMPEFRQLFEEATA
jgi:hypothetical protein